MTAPNDATLRQMTAADPFASTWLAANAGSGKTRVLTDRVARLLLAGVDPQRILCLTYTKAAASEMQNRLFQRLGAWSMLDDCALLDDLRDLGETGTLDAEALAQARTLFARAIETPGGLKIQTIHSFCGSILRRFPLEAGVNPQFREMDERLSTLLIRDVLEHMADDPAGHAFEALANEHSGHEIERFAQAVLSRKSAFEPAATQSEIWAALGLPGAYTLADHTNQAIAPGDVPMLRRVAAVLAGSGKSDQGIAAKLNALTLTRLDMPLMAALEDMFVYGPKTKQPGASKMDRVPTKAGRELIADDLDQLQHLMQRLADLQPRRRTLIAALRTWALHQFAGPFLAKYEAKKLAGSWLDFDDLITRAQKLLSDSAVAEWVLFRLDGGIDHILVDEAQDTSPTQWDVVRQLAQEFTAGQGARSDVERTIFVVGDKKQSIYSFQGADPEAFDEMRDLFRAGLAPSERPLQELSLDHSFRSSPAILDVVDKTFEATDHAGLGQDSSHIAFKGALPGRVDIWDPVEKGEEEESPEWFQTIDHISAADPRRVLAEKIADTIADMLLTGSLPSMDRSGALGQRPIEPRDILILVQRRSDLFQEIIRACKSKGLPMAGADRLNVAQELAVKDLTALLSFLATPEDSLSLAAVLRSPLFGWDEQALFDLAHRRTQSYLWPALRDRADEYPDTVQTLQDLLGMADFLRPFELIDRILTRFDGRARLIARLGSEAEEAIDALLSQALAYESTEVPSLTGFLTWLSADDLVIKRQTDSAANQIRVMTVHGSKGLEAPIVILPDTAERKAPTAPELIDAGGLVCWSPRSEDCPDQIATARAAAQARSMAERQRLLYVAMTRAETWLIVAAAGKVGDGTDSWHAQITEGLRRAGGGDVPGGLRYEPLGWPDDTYPRTTAVVTNPNRAEFPAPDADDRAEKPRSPSDLGGAKVLPGTDGDEDALPRGTAIHLLLEVLPKIPKPDWPVAAERLCIDVDTTECLASASAIIDHPDLAHLFAAGTLAEVDVSAVLPELQSPVYGSIDRLVVTPTHVLAVDYKSNRTVPRNTDDVPEGLLRQMGAYAAALGQIFPQHQIETALLWTDTCELMRLPHQAVNEALQRAASG